MINNTFQIVARRKDHKAFEQPRVYEDKWGWEIIDAPQKVDDYAEAKTLMNGYREAMPSHHVCIRATRKAGL